MRHDLHDLLDGVADAAVGARTLDARALLEQGRTRHRHSLRRRGAAALAVAAAIAVGLVLVPSNAASPPVPARPPSGPVGLPRSLPLPSPWTPTVAESPIGQASLLVGVDAAGGDWGEQGVTLVVSADGQAYRQLDVPSGQARLTDDGRHVVYGSPHEREREREQGHAKVHIVNLADGRERVVALPDSGVFSNVERLLLTPDGRTAYAVGWDGDKEAAARGSRSAGGVTWKVDLVSGAVARVLARPAFIASDGTAYAWDVGDDVADGLRAFPQPLQNAEETLIVSSPDGRGLAAATPNPSDADQLGDEPAFLVVREGKPTRLDVGVPKRHATDLLAWGAPGLLYTWDDQVRSVDPRTRDVGVVTTLEQPARGELQHESRFFVNDVAGWAARSTSSVPGVRDQAEPPWPVRVLVHPLGGLRVTTWVLLAVAVPGGAVVWSRRSRARRRPANPTR